MTRKLTHPKRLAQLRDVLIEAQTDYDIIRDRWGKKAARKNYGWRVSVLKWAIKKLSKGRK